MGNVRVFLPITKVDAEKRIVFGTITEETLDKAGEVFDYQTSKPFFEKWSDGIAKATEGKSRGNLRVMHTPKAVGKLTDLVFDDEGKRIEAAAKVVDDDEWAKVLEGVYTGFSIGGRYVKRWKDGDLDKFTADPVEVSIVDNPAVPTATFTMLKADGVEEEIEFKVWQPDNVDVARRAEKLAKDAGDEAKWPEFLNSARLELQKEHAEEPELDIAQMRRLLDAKMDDDAKVSAILAVTGSDPREDEEGLTSYKIRRLLDDDKTPSKKKMKMLRAMVDEVDPPQPSNDEELEEEAEDTPAEAGDEEDADKTGDEEDADKAGDEEEDADKEAEEDADKEAEEEAAKNAVSQVWKATDGETFDKKADAVSHQADINAGGDRLKKAVAALKKTVAGEEDPEKPEPYKLELEGAFKSPDQASKVLTKLQAIADGDELTKGLYDVQWMCRLLDDFACLHSCLSNEAKFEGSGSAIPNEIKQLVASLGQCLVAYANEEVAELIAMLSPDLVGEVITEDATDDPEVAVAAAGKALEARIGEIRKRHEEHPRGATKGAVEKLLGCSIEDAKKAIEELDQAKADNGALRKTVDASVTAIEELREDMKKLKAQPLASAPRTHVVSKEADAGGGSATSPEELSAAFAKLTPDQRADLAIRVSQMQPQKMIG